MELLLWILLFLRDSWQSLIAAAILLAISSTEMPMVASLRMDLPDMTIPINILAYRL